jgi:cell division control protein 45
MHLHRAILRTGTSLIEKRQIRHLRAFRMAIVKEGPDVQLFTHPAALTKLALWVGEAIAEQEREKRGSSGKKGTPLVLAGLNEARGVYVVVGTGGGGGLLDIAERQERKAKREAKQKNREAKKAEREKKRREREERQNSDGDENDDVEEKDDDTEDAEDNSSDDSDSDNDGVTEAKGHGRNRFGNAFQEVVDETNARVRIDSFEHCVVEVKKDDLSGFLESLSMKVVVG